MALHELLHTVSIGLIHSISFRFQFPFSPLPPPFPLPPPSFPRPHIFSFPLIPLKLLNPTSPNPTPNNATPPASAAAPCSKFPSKNPTAVLTRSILSAAMLASSDCRRELLVSAVQRKLPRINSRAPTKRRKRMLAPVTGVRRNISVVRLGMTRQEVPKRRRMAERL